MHLLKILTPLLLSAWFGLNSAQAETIIGQGKWQGIGYAIDGGWRLEQRAVGRFIVFEQDFKTRSGPDLKIYLSHTPVDRLSNNNVESTSVKLFELKSSRGPQEYMVPDDIQLGDFSSIVIHCEAHSHLWGGASIE